VQALREPQCVTRSRADRLHLKRHESVRTEERQRVARTAMKVS
jgi:hypothetical protein